MERATGIEPVLPTWESEFSILYFQYLQNRSEKMYVHALHTVHALPDLRTAGGRLGDVSIMRVAGARPQNEFVNGERISVFQESRFMSTQLMNSGRYNS